MPPVTWSSPIRGRGPPASHLHANDSVDEEEHDDEQSDVRQRLQGGEGASASTAGCTHGPCRPALPPRPARPQDPRAPPWTQVDAPSGLLR